MGKIPRHANSKPAKDTWEGQLYMSVTKELWNELTKSNNNCMYLFPNIARWNDAAAKEAFDNAKTRFVARIKNVPCDVASPDPEAYLDKVEWREDVIPEMDEITFGDEGEFGVEGFEVIDPSFSVIGWGPDEWYETMKEEEEEVKDYDGIRKWEACWAAEGEKAAVGGRGRLGCGGGMNYSSSRRRNGGGRYLWKKKKERRKW